MQANVKDLGRGLQVGAGARLGVGIGLLGLILMAAMGRWLQSQDPIGRSWEAIRSQSEYRVAGTTGARIGSRTYAHRILGKGHTNGHLQLWIDSSNEPLQYSRWINDQNGLGKETRNALDFADWAGTPAGSPLALALDIRWPKVSSLDEANLDDSNRNEPSSLSENIPDVLMADEHGLALVMPLGDPLLYLASAQPDSRTTKDVPEIMQGRICHVTRFIVPARAYADTWRSHPEFMPFNADSGGMQKFRGRGQLWSEAASGLPCRIRIEAQMPRLAGPQAGHGETDFVYMWRTTMNGD